MERNPWTIMGISTLFKYYLTLQPYVGVFIYSLNDLVSFIRRDLDVVYIPDLFPLNASIPIDSHALTKENAFLILQWIKLRML